MFRQINNSVITVRIKWGRKEIISSIQIGAKFVDNKKAKLNQHVDSQLIKGHKKIKCFFTNKRLINPLCK